MKNAVSLVIVVITLTYLSFNISSRIFSDHSSAVTHKTGSPTSSVSEAQCLHFALQHSRENRFAEEKKCVNVPTLPYTLTQATPTLAEINAASKHFLVKYRSLRVQSGSVSNDTVVEHTINQATAPLHK